MFINMLIILTYLEFLEEARWDRLENSDSFSVDDDPAILPLCGGKHQYKLQVVRRY